MTELQDLNEMAFGKEAAQKIVRFHAGLERIENNHSDYFKNRKATNDFDVNDRLHNHYITVTNSVGITFTFTEESNLREDIKADCNVLFRSIFNLES